jgi:hypothetical protein
MDMDSKHTPGPWEFDESFPAGAFVTATSGEIVADTFFVAGDTDISTANARLIAAAPELLERLEELLEYNEILRGSAVYKRAQDAITKATGA